MTGAPFLPSTLPGGAPAIVLEAAFGADLTDIDGSGWTWTDLSTRLQHGPGTSVTIGRSDNVSQAGAASLSAVVDNSDGALTPVSNADVVQNTPIRQRITLSGSIFLTRFQGYADSFNPVYNTTGKVKQISLTALGMLGRLGGRKKPLLSALSRAINLSGPTAWWPMEDPAGAVQASSSVAGVPPLTVTLGAPAFGVAGPDGAAGAVDLGASNTGFEVKNLPASSATSWRLEWSMIAPDSAGQLPIAIYTTGGEIYNISIQNISGSNINVHTEITDGTNRDDAASASASDGLWHRMRFDVAKSGSSTTYDLSIDGTSILSQTLTGVEFGQINIFRIGSSLGAGLTAGTRMAVTGCVIWQPIPASSDTLNAQDGYTGETADDRMFRLCAEENIFLDMHGTSTVTMGPQGVDTILNLLRECEAADHGLLADGTNAGLYYQTRNQRYNASAALTLDVSAKQLAPPFTPRFDKQAVKNQYAVTRKGGGTVTFARSDGPVGTDTIGIEDAAVTVNIDTDDPLIQHAGWLVSLGTVPGFRYPGVALDLRSIPSKAASLLVALPGFRTTLTNPDGPDPDFPGDDIDLIVEGWTEVTTATSWKTALNTSPYQPYRVFILDTDVLDGPAVLAL